jgi:hypothetical protein
VMLSLLLLVGLASASGFYLETPALRDRAEAVSIQQAALDRGLSARVVRQYRHGAGWQYTVVVEGLPDRETADAVAADIAARTRRGISVFSEDLPHAPLALEVDASEPEATLPPPEEILALVARAHGGSGGGRARLEQSAVQRLRYERRVVTPEGLVRAHHDWSQMPDRWRMDLEILEGPGRDLSLEIGERAWLDLDGQRLERELAPSLELMLSYGPEAMLGRALDLPALASKDPAWRMLGVAGEISIEGRRCAALSYAGPEVPGALEVFVDLQSWTVTRLVLRDGAGALSWTFSEWREIDSGVVVPYHTRIERAGEFLEEIQVFELELSTTVPTMP